MTENSRSARQRSDGIEQHRQSAGANDPIPRRGGSPAHWLVAVLLGGIFASLIHISQIMSGIQNSMEAQISSEMTALQANHHYLVAADDELADILIRARSGEPMSTSDNLRYRFRTTVSISLWENLFSLHKKGFIDDDHYEAMKMSWASLTKNSAGYRRVWCQIRSQLAPDFRAEAEEQFGDLVCD